MTAAAPRRVTVMGAGIVGVACAVYLQRDGHHVTVVDRLEPGEACSFGNAGALGGNSCIPMSMPGILREVPGWLLDPLGPLSIHWGYLPRLLPWLWRFVRAGRPDRIEAIADGLRALHRPAVASYQDLLASAGAPDLVRASGYLHVYRSEAGFAAGARAIAMRRERGVNLEVLDGPELRQLEPALSPDYRRALYMPDDGHVRNPGRVVKALAEHFVRSGGTLLRREVRDMEIGADGPVRLRTDGGDLDIDVLVVAAGAWSGSWAAKLGSPVPLESERGYHVTIADPGIETRHPIMAVEDKFAATTMEMGLRVAGTAEFAGLEAPPNYARARALLGHCKRMFPAARTAGFSEWMGHRPGLPDTIPVVSASPRHGSVFYAFGHGHHGLTAAPATGQIIADLVARRPPAIDPAPYRVDRF